MNAYLIDPFAKTVTEVEYGGNYQEIYQLIDCDTFDVVRINNKGDAIFVDDEGLINGKPQAFFMYQDYPQPITGKGLVLGSDTEGETTAPRISFDELCDKIWWFAVRRAEPADLDDLRF